MFFPVGAVIQVQGGQVLPVLDPECRHDVQCGLECHNREHWHMFINKLNTLLLPKPKEYVLTVHSLAMCDIELARGTVTRRGKREWVNHYSLE